MMSWRNLCQAVRELDQPSCFLHQVRRAAILCGLAAAMTASPVAGQQAPAIPAHPAGKTHHAAKPKPAVPESIPQVIMPAPPPPERRVPEQMPPDVPQVSWDGSQLTITADNSTLADILVAIRTRTGADIDVPPNASRERIAARLGPGPAREIIATLLSWTDFDYVIQASDNDPAGVQSVILTYRGKPEEVVARSAADNLAARRPNRRPSPAQVQESSGSSEAETSPETPVAATQPPPAESQPAPTVAASDPPAVQANLNPAPTTANSDLNPPLADSPDERMQTLQGLYQQRRQMMQDARKTPAN